MESKQNETSLIWRIAELESQNATLIEQNEKLRSDLEYAVDCLQKTSEPALIAIANRMSQTLKDAENGR